MFKFRKTRQLHLGASLLSMGSHVWRIESKCGSYFNASKIGYLILGL
jgi:hypothetical protein